MAATLAERVLGVAHAYTDAVHPGRLGARIAVGIWVAIIGFSLIGLPAPALAGEGLVVVLALGAMIAVVAYDAWRRPCAVATRTAFAVVLGLCGAALAEVSSSGSAIIACYAAVGMAARTLPWRASLIAAAPVIAAANAVIVLGADEPLLTLLWTDFGFVFALVISQLARVGELQTRRAHELLAEEQRTREARAEAARLGERGRIAREMHDVLAHSLSALAVQLEGTRLLAADRDADPELQRAIERSHRLAATGLSEARAAIEALRGDHLPGPDRLSELAADFEADEGIPCAFAASGEPRPLSSQARLAIYRVGQEALTNVRRHAAADRVEIGLRYEPEGTSLVVADHGAPNGDGRGPDAVVLAEAGSGYGVNGMRERAELLGGRLAAGPTGDGYRVEMWLPRSAEAEA